MAALQIVRTVPTPRLALFSTAAVGIDADGYQDNTKRRVAWEQAHDGKIRHDRDLYDWTAFLAGAVPFPFPGGTGPSFPDLAAVLKRLDQAEAAGLCPVHRRPTEAPVSPVPETAGDGGRPVPGWHQAVPS